jgi:hypothetical protein
MTAVERRAGRVIFGNRRPGAVCQISNYCPVSYPVSGRARGAEHRASIEGEESPCPGDLLRLSVGLEDADDLYLDLERALELAV